MDSVQHQKWEELMQFKWFPAAYDYYKILEKLTSNTGVKIPNRYPGNGGISECSVKEAEGMTEPGVNLPSDWMFAPVEYNWKDPSLQDGQAYFVEQEPYMDWVKKIAEQKDMSTYTGLAALDHANTKFNQGYDESGKGAGLCARHEMNLPNGIGATQIGESSIYNASHFHFAFPGHQWSKNLIERLKKLPPLVWWNLIAYLVVFVIPKLHILGHLLKCQEKFSLSYTPGVGQTDSEGIERDWAGLGGVATSIKEMGLGSHHDTLEDHIGHWNWCKIVEIGPLLKKQLLNAVSEFDKQSASWIDFNERQREFAPTWKKLIDDYELKLTDENPYAFPYQMLFHKSAVITLSSAAFEKVGGKTLQSVRLELAKEAEKMAKEDLRKEEAQEISETSSGTESEIDGDEVLEELDGTSPGEFIFFGLEIEHQQRHSTRLLSDAPCLFFPCFFNGLSGLRSSETFANVAPMQPTSSLAFAKDPPTTGRNGKLWKTWNGRQNGAVDFILTRLDDSVLGHVNEYQEDPAGLWHHLHAVFGDSGVGGGVQAWQRFAAVRFTGWDVQMSTVTGKIRGIADELERVHDDRPSDNQIIATMLSACAAFSEFRPIIASLESSKELLKVDDVELQLIWAAKDFTEERGRLNGGAIIPGDQTQALATTTGARPICTNPKCGRVGHTIENCFHEGGGKEGQFPDWYFKNCGKEETGAAVNNAMATFVL
ncbi:hypothetical protein D9758_002054 [Tetrapyrgos nigripes]|uniref:CCHC-type domain-containing protein n=1 Tax=Tetrapyrgos nigripes TaxID=182062 RepID=A0A8H5GT81_9AGAR|nr:hypothetical protein D9758_002054 [Tetrapyrgos nigripes]